MDRQALRSDLIRDEGRKLEAYKDTLGYWTIGVGHFLNEGPTPRMSLITNAECDALLDADINEAVRIAQRYVTIFPPNFTDGDIMTFSPEDDVRARALVNMAFNLGNKLGQFKNSLAYINSTQWEAAAANLLQSKWAKQVGKRATRIAEMIRTGRA